MAYTQSDLDALRAAKTSPVAKVRYSDGREVTYRSLSEIIAAEKAVEAELNGNKPRTVLAEFNRA